MKQSLTINHDTTKTNMTTTNKYTAIGIDVSKKTLSLCFRNETGCQIMEILNTEKDIKKLAKEIKRENYQGKIIIESTGKYHMLCAVILTEHNLDVRVINPLLTKKYSSAAIRKVKTDKQDSQILAEMALIENNLPESFCLTRETLILRKKISLIASLEKQIQQLQAIANDYQTVVFSFKKSLSGSEKKIIKSIIQLKKQKDQLEQEVEQISENIDKDKSNSVSERRNQFNSIPGVSSYVATLSTIYFSKDYSDHPKQWIAYCGLDISVKESGMWKGKGKLTKRGNPYLRKRLFSAAWGAVMHDKQFKSYYDYLRKNNRNYVEALTIIARKIVRIMFMLSKNNTVFDPTKLIFQPL